MVLDDIIETYFSIDNLKHAYLLHANDFSNVIKVAKKILFDSNTEVQNLENLIENGSYIDLKIIEPDGQWIKKEQIIQLKESFNTKSIYNNKKIYIIKNAENLNKAAANTMLKFLEEPEENIVAFLVTNNKTKVLDTLVSRCQYIDLELNKNVKKEISKDANDLYHILEQEGRNASFTLIGIFDKYEDRNQIKKNLHDLLYIYEQIMLIKIGIKKEVDYEEEFDKTIKNNTIEEIQKKVNAIIFLIDSLEYNINLKLMVDKLLVMMFGVE